VGRENWIFAGSAAIYTLIETAKLNDIDPQAWLADVLARLPDRPAKPAKMAASRRGETNKPRPGTPQVNY